MSETRRRDDRSAVKARDIVWLGALPLAQIERRVRGDGTTRSADVLSLHPGHLGEPREARDADGTVVWRWDGDAFGANMGGTPAVNRDPDGDGVNTSVSLRFPGQYHDRESGLFYNHHRDYDPKLGRYIQSDPIGLAGGVNRYGYVGGDPVNFVDPTGLVRDTGRCTGSRTCSGLARTFVYSGNITDCYVWDTYTNGTYTGTSPGGCNYTDISGQFSTIGDGTQYAQFGPIDPLLRPFPIQHDGCLVNSGLSFCLRKKRYEEWANNKELCKITAFARAARTTLDSLDTPRLLTRYSAPSMQILEEISSNLETRNNLAFTSLLAGQAIPGVTDASDGIDRGMVRFEQELVQWHLNNYAARDATGYSALISESNQLLNGTFSTLFEHINTARARIGGNIDFSNQAHRQEIGYALVENEAAKPCE